MCWCEPREADRVCYTLHMKAIFGDVAILSDAYPLHPRVSIRLAAPLDPACNCGAAATFVLLEADKAKYEPRLPNLEDRMSSAWVCVHQSVCGNHLGIAVRDLSMRIALS
jgi:hypothetical protein